MNSFSKYLGCAITFGIFLVIIVAVSSLFWDGEYGGKPIALNDIMPLIVCGIILLVAFVVCIAGCIRHRKDPKSVVRTPMVQTSGFHIGGLPCQGSAAVEMKLFKDVIQFEIYQDLLGVKKQIFTLSIDKINSIRKFANYTDFSVITPNSTSATNNSTDSYGFILIEYTSDGVDKQITISLPLISNANSFIKQYNKLKPDNNNYDNNNPIEL